MFIAQPLPPKRGRLSVRLGNPSRRQRSTKMRNSPQKQLSIAPSLEERNASASNRTILVPNLPIRFDPATALTVPTVDLSSLDGKWGQLRIATEGRVHPDNIKPMLADVRAAVDELVPGDIILIMGDVVCVAAALATAWDRMGDIIVLKWRKELSAYAAVAVPDLWAEPEHSLEIMR